MKKKTAPKMPPKMPKGFEQSKYDNDKGVKEGSPADLKRDKKQMPAFLKKGKK